MWLFFVGHMNNFFYRLMLYTSVEKHVRNTLKNTPFPTVPAIRTGQDLHAIGVGPDPDGWKPIRETYPDWAKRGVHGGPTPAKYSVRPMVPFPVQSITLYRKSAKNLSKQEREELFLIPFI